VYTYSEAELNKLLKNLERRGKKYKEPIQRYKGLGEMDADQLADTTMDPGHRTLRRVRIEDAEAASAVFELLMGSEVAPRRRVIPCLDVDAGRVVKGVNFKDLRDAGDPVELAARYGVEGADELTFLDVTASSGGRETMIDVVRAAAEQIFIPLTVGGGVRTVEDVDQMLRAGADKCGVNTAAIARPEVISEISRRFGNQVLVLSIDARRVTDDTPEGTARSGSGFEVTTHGGRRGTGIDAIAWIRE